MALSGRLVEMGHDGHGCLFMSPILRCDIAPRCPPPAPACARAPRIVDDAETTAMALNLAPVRLENLLREETGAEYAPRGASKRPRKSFVA